MGPINLQELLENAFPGAEVKATDMTGGGDHWNVSIVAKEFEGLNLVQQHQLVYKALGDLMKEDIHALALNTSAP
jgi:stress-induced morphogen